ncbi:uncharacterized protein LOC129751620 [Uranotaenia lowii]|uniref:uncharacterized protein LOC129751620 n=1 Tax=Uranotaenia lowii TaxID=190385 RepID=UPI00247A43E6|nr:uncharacterized protein LOC129751620 [Uranotaenia lowii]
MDFPYWKIATKSNNSVKNFFTKVKDSLCTMDQHNINYSIPCTSCLGQYIGQTKQLLKKRMSKHKSSQTKLDTMLKTGYNYSSSEIKALTNSTTAMIKHCITHRHRFDTGKVKVLDRSYHSNRLNTLETFHIKATKNAISFEEG